MRTKAALQGQRGQLLQVDFSKAREGGSVPFPLCLTYLHPALVQLVVFLCYVFSLIRTGGTHCAGAAKELLQGWQPG